MMFRSFAATRVWVRARPVSFLASVPAAPPDPILGLTEAFIKDTFPSKVNVGVGAFRDEVGKPWVLPSVEEAAKRLSARIRADTEEYAPVDGDPKFVKVATKFAYGADSPALKDNRIAGAQALSGTGALRIGFEFLQRFAGKDRKVFVPSPTWPNHLNIIRDSGLQFQYYRYLKPDRVTLDIDGMLADIAAAPSGSVFLFHACAHNPTGVDPTQEQWRALSDAVKAKEHFPFFDSAYQGFSSGSADRDAFALRHFVSEGHTMMLAQSFAKNFGLYGERVGTISVVTENAAEAAKVLSQLKIVIRPMYSSPPIHGARLVSEILSDPGLTNQWTTECKSMADRIASMRQLLTKALTATGSPRDWSHIESQIGMFCYTGLSESEAKKLVETHHIYMTKDGRISMAGVNPKNVGYLADCIHKVTSS